MKAILGVDVGSEGCQARRLSGDYEAEALSVDNPLSGFKQLRRYLKQRRLKTLHVGREATRRYDEGWADLLDAVGCGVSVVNPARINAYADSRLTRHTTDRLDAARIADFCRTQDPARWPPPPEWRELPALVRHREAVPTDVQRQRNRPHALRHAAHPAPGVLAKVAHPLAWLQTQLPPVNPAIQPQLDQPPDLKRDKALLPCIPGSGDVTAGKLLAEVGCSRDFSDVRQLVAFAGLNPRQHQSGKTTRGHTPISQQGRASIRAARFLPACRRCQNPRECAPTPGLTFAGARLVAPGACRRGHAQVVAFQLRCSPIGAAF